MIPKTLLAGFTVNIPYDPGSLYGPDQGWSALLLLRGPSKIDVVAITDPANPKTFIFKAVPTDTESWTAGTYWYVVKISNGVDAYQLESGETLVKVDPTQADAFDGRSENKKMLDAITALMTSKATLDQERYKIGNRELFKIPIGELINLKKYYQQQYNAELRLANGGSLFGPPVRIRFD